MRLQIMETSSQFCLQLSQQPHEKSPEPIPPAVQENKIVTLFELTKNESLRNFFRMCLEEVKSESEKVFKWGCFWKEIKKAEKEESNEKNNIEELDILLDELGEGIAIKNLILETPLEIEIDDDGIGKFLRKILSKNDLSPEKLYEIIILLGDKFNPDRIKTKTQHEILERFVHWCRNEVDLHCLGKIVDYLFNLDGTRRFSVILFKYYVDNVNDLNWPNWSFLEKATLSECIYPFADYKHQEEISDCFIRLTEYFSDNGLDAVEIFSEFDQFFKFNPLNKEVLKNIFDWLWNKISDFHIPCNNYFFSKDVDKKESCENFLSLISPRVGVCLENQKKSEQVSEAVNLALVTFENIFLDMNKFQNEEFVEICWVQLLAKIKTVQELQKIFENAKENEQSQKRLALLSQIIAIEIEDEESKAKNLLQIAVSAFNVDLEDELKEDFILFVLLSLPYFSSDETVWEESLINKLQRIEKYPYLEEVFFQTGLMETFLSNKEIFNKFYRGVFYNIIPSLNNSKYIVFLVEKICKRVEFEIYDELFEKKSSEISLSKWIKSYFFLLERGNHLVDYTLFRLFLEKFGIKETVAEVLNYGKEGVIYNSYLLLSLAFFDRLEKLNLEHWQRIFNQDEALIFRFCFEVSDLCKRNDLEKRSVIFLENTLEFSQGDCIKYFDYLKSWQKKHIADKFEQEPQYFCKESIKFFWDRFPLSMPVLIPFIRWNLKIKSTRKEFLAVFQDRLEKNQNWAQFMGHFIFHNLVEKDEEIVQFIVQSFPNEQLESLLNTMDEGSTKFKTYFKYLSNDQFKQLINEKSIINNCIVENIALNATFPQFQAFFIENAEKKIRELGENFSEEEAISIFFQENVTEQVKEREKNGFLKYLSYDDFLQGDFFYPTPAAEEKQRWFNFFMTPWNYQGFLETFPDLNTSDKKINAICEFLQSTTEWGGKDFPKFLIKKLDNFQKVIGGEKGDDSTFQVLLKGLQGSEIINGFIRNAPKIELKLFHEQISLMSDLFFPLLNDDVLELLWQKDLNFFVPCKRLSKKENWVMQKIDETDFFKLEWSEIHGYLKILKKLKNIKKVVPKLMAIDFISWKPFDVRKFSDFLCKLKHPPQELIDKTTDWVQQKIDGIDFFQSKWKEVAHYLEVLINLKNEKKAVAEIEKMNLETFDSSEIRDLSVFLRNFKNPPKELLDQTKKIVEAKIKMNQEQSAKGLFEAEEHPVFMIQYDKVAEANFKALQALLKSWNLTLESDEVECDPFESLKNIFIYFERNEKTFGKKWFEEFTGLINTNALGDFNIEGYQQELTEFLYELHKQENDMRDLSYLLNILNGKN